MKKARLVAGGLVLASVVFIVLYMSKRNLTGYNDLVTETNLWGLSENINEEVQLQLQKNDSGITQLILHDESINEEIQLQLQKNDSDISQMILHDESINEEIQLQLQKNDSDISQMILHDESISDEVQLQQQQIDISQLLVRVQDRIHTCLDATGMKDYFVQEGLLNTSLTTATVFVKRIRELIPGSFMTGTPNHCWAKNVSLKVKNHAGREYEAWGTYGDIKFSYQGKPYSRTHIHRRSYYQTGSGDSLRESMVCLPQVFLAGYVKCGSTHLYSLLCQHPMVVKPRTKEPHWWQHAEFFTQNTSRNSFFFTDYLMMFKELVIKMQKTHNFNLLSVEGSPNYLYNWPPFGDHPCEHYCLLPAVIPEILPRSKYLVVMRNPVDMLYSAFWFSCIDLGTRVPQSVQLKGPNIFHERVLTKINSFKLCIQDFPLVKCVLDMTKNIFTQEMHCGRTRLEMGVYYVHTLKWLSIVPRSEFLFLTMEELSADTDGTMTKVWQFLGLPHITLHSGHAGGKNTQTKYDYHHDPRLAMREDTRKLLVDFFAPYNRMLADLLGDDKFLWTT